MTNPTPSNAPHRIWLQHHEDGEITWASERLSDEDTEYVVASHAPASPAVNEQLPRFSVQQRVHIADPTLLIWGVCDGETEVLGLAGKELADKVCGLLNGVHASHAPASPAVNEELLAFIRAKSQEAYKAMRCRLDSEECWRDQTDADAKEGARIATAMTGERHKTVDAAERGKIADSERRIAKRYEREGQMFDRIHDALSSHAPAVNEEIERLRDAANKGELARMTAAGMEQEIERLTSDLAEARKQIADLQANAREQRIGQESMGEFHQHFGKGGSNG